MRPLLDRFSPLGCYCCSLRIHVKINSVMNGKPGTNPPLNISTLEPETQAKQFVLPEPNPVTMARHRREVFRQITFPLILIVLIFLALVVLAWIATAMQASLWADISIILLSTLLVLMLFLGIAILAGIAYLVIYLNQSLPPYTRLVQDYTDQARHYARLVADKSVAPIMQSRSFSASMRALRAALGRLGKPGRV